MIGALLAGSVLAPARQAWRGLEGIGSLPEIARDMRGMRRDLREVIAHIDGLRDEVRSLGAGVGGIRASTESLDAKIDAVTVNLQNVSALAGRLGRLGGRRARADAS